MFGSTENLTLGSIGFAQLGRDDYYEKRQIEKKVLAELLGTPTFENKFPDLCRIKIVKEPYEYESYDEVVIVYNSDKLDRLEDSDEERFNEFWEWANELEGFDFESEELMDKCEKLYAQEYKLSVVHKRQDVSPELFNQAI